MKRTRMRGGRSDWESLSPRRQAAESLLQKRLAGMPLAPEEQAIVDSLPAPRARPVQHEAGEMLELAHLVQMAWWAPGYQRWEHRSSSERESEQRWREGASSGWPDCGLFIPGRLLHPGLMAVCELKAVSPHRPAKAPRDEWWLDPFEGGHKTKHGLRLDQQAWLRRLHYCGMHTFVAFGAAEAFEWLSRIAGPRPRVLPDGW